MLWVNRQILKHFPQPALGHECSPCNFIHAQTVSRPLSHSFHLKIDSYYDRLVGLKEAVSERRYMDGCPAFLGGDELSSRILWILSTHMCNFDFFFLLPRNLTDVVRGAARLTRISPYVSRTWSFSFRRSSWSMSLTLRIRDLYCRNWWISSAFCIACCLFSSSVCNTASSLVFLDIKCQMK